MKEVVMTVTSDQSFPEDTNYVSNVLEKILMLIATLVALASLFPPALMAFFLILGANEQMSDLKAETLKDIENVIVLQRGLGLGEAFFLIIFFILAIATIIAFFKKRKNYPKYLKALNSFLKVSIAVATSTITILGLFYIKDAATGADIFSHSIIISSAFMVLGGSVSYLVFNALEALSEKSK